MRPPEGHMRPPARPTARRPPPSQETWPCDPQTHLSVHPQRSHQAAGVGDARALDNHVVKAPLTQQLVDRQQHVGPHAAADTPIADLLLAGGGRGGGVEGARNQKTSGPLTLSHSLSPTRSSGY